MTVSYLDGVKITIKVTGPTDKTYKIKEPYHITVCLCIKKNETVKSKVLITTFVCHSRCFM